MAEDELDLSEFEEYSETAAAARGVRGGKGGKKQGGDAAVPVRRRWPWLVAGVILGVASAIFLPDLVGPYLPDALRPSLEEVRGPVLGKRSEGERLLLTVDTERGALLATFRQRVPEIDLLVQQGDTVALEVREYAPLVEDPVLTAVSKGRAGSRAAPPASPGGGPDAGAAGPADADTVGESGPDAPDSVSSDTAALDASPPDTTGD